MLHFIQLLFELILFGSVIYLYWRFHERVKIDQDVRSNKVPTIDIDEVEAEVVRIAQGMFDLLKEFQTSSNILKDDLCQQLGECNKATKHAELVLSELGTKIHNTPVAEGNYSVDKPPNRRFNSMDLESLEIDTPIGVDPAWIVSQKNSNSTSYSQFSGLSEINRYQAVVRLANQGTTPEDISLRTGLERETIRILLRNNQQSFDKDKVIGG